MKISYTTYLDKVYGAWLGKSIAGTIGAPFEGRKELFNYEYDPKAIKEMLPNDDLDLQVLWLHVLEKKGIYLNSMDLADGFYHLYPYVPGEYAYFKKNYNRGIYPPLSGSFNNRYYINGMGCPIRSEIWACISPGNPDLAAEYAGKDGILDHEGDSVYAEQFLAAIEALAFFEEDLFQLFEKGMRFLPENTKIRHLIQDTIAWSQQETQWVKVRSWIIRDYGHPDCTNLYQNMGFTLLALIYGKGDFIDTTMIALNCGFDTDCSCATAGALLGIIHGAANLIEKHHFYDTSYKLDVKVERRSNHLKDLAEDTCIVGLTVLQELNKRIEIEHAPVFTPVPFHKPEKRINISIDYQGIPVIGWKETKTLLIKVINETDKDIGETVCLEIPHGWAADWLKKEILLSAHEEVNIPLKITIPADVNLICEKNLICVKCGAEKVKFGLNGAQVWKAYGPFWENHIDLPYTELGETYYTHIEGTSPDEIADISRQFHLNTKVSPGKDYFGEPGLSPKEMDYKIVNIKEDLFSVSDFVGFQGPCIVYAVRRIFCPEERVVNLILGHTDAYQLWINGNKTSEADYTDWWTAENRHITSVHLRQGENEILLKCIRTGKSAEYSLIFTGCEKVFPPHIDDFSSIVE
ncbi:MAG TPA: ADP-ribosylglycohydrolase family protein [Bacilli bacterium]